MTFRGIDEPRTRLAFRLMSLPHALCACNGYTYDLNGCRIGGKIDFGCLISSRLYFWARTSGRVHSYAFQRSILQVIKASHVDGFIIVAENTGYETSVNIHAV